VSATFCDACGAPQAAGGHAECAERRRATDPPRFCTACSRKLVVQVLPRSWRAMCVRCGTVEAVDR
jgi:hypothetical protein